MEWCFIIHDPFPGLPGQPATLNPYVYALNNPLLYTDPSGENPLIIAALIGGIIGGGINLGMQLYNLQPNSLYQVLHCVDWGSVAVSFGAGAVAGMVGFGVFGATTAIIGNGFLANVFAGSLSGVFAGQCARLTALALTGQMSQAGNTLFRPQDMLIDAVLGGVIAGAIYGASFLLDGYTHRVATEASNVPNPNGRLGGPPHQAGISQITNDLTTSNLEYLTEFKVATPGGYKPYRFADVVSLDSKGNPTAIYQVGKITQANLPVARERYAIIDIFEFGMYDVPIYFFPYR